MMCLLLVVVVAENCFTSSGRLSPMGFFLGSSWEDSASEPSPLVDQPSLVLSETVVIGLIWCSRSMSALCEGGEEAQEDLRAELRWLCTVFG